MGYKNFYAQREITLEIIDLPKHPFHIMITNGQTTYFDTPECNKPFNQSISTKMK